MTKTMGMLAIRHVAALTMRRLSNRLQRSQNP
jgi:hypothetical protein